MKLVPHALVVSALLLPQAFVPAFAQEDDALANDRELAGLVEEQSNLIRQLSRLRGTMQVLLDRIQAEGRTRTAELLSDAIKRLDERMGGDAEGITLGEAMERARTAMAEGRLVQSIETQSKLVDELQGLLDILLDRQSLERLEKELADVRELREQVEALANREQQLRAETEQLRQDSANDAQKALEADIQKLLEQESERLRQAEADARASGAFEMEALKRELSELLKNQKIDQQVMQSWNPERNAAWDEAKKAVEGQRKGVDKTKEGEVKPRELKQRQPKPIVYAIDRNLEKRLGNLNDCMAELDFASSTVNDDGTLKVHDIQQGSLLEKVGLQENDVLERVGGKVIDFNSFQECHNAWQESLQKLRSGTPIVVEIKRKGKLQQLIVAPDF